MTGNVSNRTNEKMFHKTNAGESIERTGVWCFTNTQKATRTPYVNMHRSCGYGVYGARVPPSLCVLRALGSSSIVWDISKVRMQQNALAGDHASNRMEPVHSFSLAAQMRIKILGESMLDSSTGCSAFLSHLQGHWLRRPVPSLWYDFLFGQGDVRTVAPFFPRSVTSRSAGL